MISVRVDMGPLGAAMKRISDKLGSGRIVKAAQLGLGETVAGFYRAKNSTFWGQFMPTAQDGFKLSADGTTAKATLSGYNAAILAHKYNGGPIAAKAHTYLAIPMSSKARKAGPPSHGKTPDLFPLTIHGHKFLARRWKGKAAKHKPLELWYLLVKSVMQRPHPDALPTAEEIRAGVQPYVVDEIRRIFGAT